jgi:hypothetical protein
LYNKPEVAAVPRDLVPPHLKKRGRRKLRLFDDVREDLRILKVKHWRSTARDRDAWGLLEQEAKTHKGL